ncbi:MAG: restriction endonuclease subunit S [Methylococcales bacterium]|nr:restriction endonuclease subunit S [Methylococcales bacterium]
MKGLEAVEISLSECQSVIDFRIDASTYKKEYLKTEALLNKRQFLQIEDISISVQNFGAYSLCNFIDFKEEGIPFLMTKNIRENYIDWNIEKYVTQESHEMLWKSHCQRGQVLITMAGEYLGRVAVYDRDEIVSSNQAIAKVTLKNDKNPYFVATFLNSKHGQNQIQRFKTITGQPNINMALIKSLKIPLVPAKFESEIEEIVRQSEQIKGKSSQVYSKAETQLLNALGMANFLPSTEKVNIKSFKDSFAGTGRLDAEYYQPKYEEMMAHIAAQAHEKLASLVTIQKSIEPGSDAYTEDEEGLPFLRVADYNKFGITEPQKMLKASFVTENKMKLAALKPKANTILFSKDGSVGEAFCLRKDANFITSGAVLHLIVRDTKQVLPDYLTLALNSKLVRMQAERDAGGSIILHWRISEIENVIVPVVDMTIQTQIADLVQQSFALKAESERLLATAKRAVEIAIETDEQTAMDYINEQTGEKSCNPKN